MAHASSLSTQGRHRQISLSLRSALSNNEFQASQGYVVRPCLKKKKVLIVVLGEGQGGLGAFVPSVPPSGIYSLSWRAQSFRRVHKNQCTEICALEKMFLGPVRQLAAKSDDLSLSLGTYLVEGRTDSCKLSSDLHHGTYIHTNRDACNTENYFKREGRWP